MFTDGKTRVSAHVVHPLMVPLLFAATAAWGQSYTAAELTGGIDAFTVGGAGQAVGITQTKDGYEQPLAMFNGNVVALDALHSDDGARALAVNASGVVAGYSCLGRIPTCTAVTWTAGGTPKAFADRFFPRAINDAGDIAGYVFEENDNTHLAVWRNGVLSALPLFPQQTPNNLGAVNAINNAGAIAGELDVADVNGALTSHAVVWSGSKIQDLGANASAKDLNDHGQVVGYVNSDAAVWTNGVLTDLGNLGGFTVAYGVNNSGVIVGSANLPFDPSSASSAAVVWISGVMYQLSDLIKPRLPNGIQLLSAQAINDSGQILAAGYDTVGQKSRSYVLSPAGVVPDAAAPTLSILPGTYITTQTVKIADVTPAATIHYTVDGTTPTTRSPVYATPLTISKTTSLKAVAVAAGYTVSAVAKADYTFVAAGSAFTKLDVSSAANVQAIGPLGIRAHVGLDGYRNVYASDLLGSSLVWSGVQFDFIDSPSANGAAGVTLGLPAGKYSALKLLGTSSRGNQSAETFIVTYTDGTSSSIVQGMSDWLTPKSYPGESTALTMDHRIAHSGIASAGPYHLYGYTLNLNPAKTVRSLTLPASSYVVVLAGALVSSAK